MKSLIYFAVGTMAVLSLLTQAQAVTPPQKDIEHVLVTVPIHRTEATTAYPVTLLSGDELYNQVANTIGNTLANKPGLSSASFGPSVGQPVIRGQQGARVMVLQNSTSSADASNISADHSVNVEPILAQSIEVLRGPSTLLYGGGAIGGVVNVIDRRVPINVPDQLTGTAEVRYGSVNDEKTAVFSLEGGADQLAVHVDGMTRKSNNVEVAGFAVSDQLAINKGGDGFIVNSDSDTNAVTFGTSYFFDTGFIGLAVNRLVNEYGIPAAIDEDEIVRIDIEQIRYDLRADSHQPITGVENLRWFFTYSDYQHDELEGGEVGTQWSNDSWENRLELLHSPIAGWHGVLGLQIKKSDFAAVGDESYIPETTINNYGLFIVEDMHRGDWVYEVGTRFDIDELEPDSSAEDVSFNSASFSVSALWQINDPWSVGVALSQSKRAPVIEELFSNNENSLGSYVEHVATGVIELGDLNLKQEQANNVDLSLNYNSESIEAFVSVFYNDFQDYIFLTDTNSPQVDVPVLQYSQENAVFSGVEFELKFLAGSVLGAELGLEFFGDMIEAELDRTGDVPRLPPSRVGGRLTFELERGQKKLSSFFSVLAANSQDSVGLNQEKTDGYVRWDFGINYQININESQQWLAFLRVKNITNEEIRNASSFLKDIAPEAGRSIDAGLRFSF